MNNFTFRSFILCTSFFFLAGALRSQPCNSNAPVVYTIAPTAPNEIYITDASTRPWKGGDTLLIPAGTYTVIEIDSFGGDPCRDIYIKNSGGQVVVNGAIRFGKDVHHVKIVGNGSNGITYGFKCMTFSFGRVSHWTMRRIEIGPNPNGVGIYGQQIPLPNNPATWYPNYVNRKITIDSVYVHNIGGEGMYIGNTSPDGGPYNNNLIPQRLDSVTISNCIVDSTDWDGIQLSNARDGCLIFNNTVTHFGLIDMNSQRAGIISGGNTNSQVYNNTVTNGTGNGIQFFGYGVMNCYNNRITNVGNTIHNIRNGISVGEESLFGGAYGNGVETNPKQAMVIYNNQIDYPKPWGAIRFYDFNNAELENLHDNKFCFVTPPPANWQSLYIFLQAGYININNILYCNGGPNQPPAANAGPDILITLPTNTATLSGSGTDPDGTITAYSWVKIAGPTPGTLVNANTATATAIGLVAGVYSYQLTVTDNLGATGKDTMIVTVNQPPVANAGPDILITLPTNTATLSGSGTDPDGTITAYAWVKIAGPAAGTLVNANTATATASGLVAGVYSYQLTVTDNRGATGKDTVNVTVNQPPIANAGPDILITLPINTATLSGSGTDPDGTITAYAWIKIAGPAAGTLANANTATATASGLVAGVYSYQLTVTDNRGATGKDTVNVTVNQPPTANAGPDILITLPINTATLSGSGTDPDGTITAYAWIKIAGPAAGTLANANTATATASGLVAGVYSYQLTVTDNRGATGKDTVNVTVNQPPTANAGPDILITLPTNTATLSGSGTDPDGTIAGYAWVKIAGPAPGTLTNANTATATASGLVAGVYSYQLTVTDNRGATGKDTMIVTVNQPPVANAGPDILITLPTNTATLSGSGTDPDGTIAAYAWVKIAGPAPGTLANANTATATASGLVAGVYSYQLTVTDNLGATGKDTVNVTVNQPPTANAGPDILITLPTNTATLSGSGTDPDGTITAYSWIKIAGPAPGTLANANTATATPSGLVAGVYSYQLTVTDNLGATGKDTMNVTVNQPPVANAGPDILITLPTNTATLSGSGTDPDGTITAYSWVKIAGPAAGTLANANTATATASGLVAGVYSYQLTVTDNLGATGKDTMNVTVNQPPIANAGPDILITLPTNTATLSGSATDPDGTITAYSWVKIAGPAPGTLANANTATATASGLVAGVYSYQLTVTDNLGATGKDTVNVNVNPAANQLPTANAGPDITITLPNNTATLNGSGTDPDGTITAYAWAKIAGPAAGTLANASTATATASGLAEGMYSYQLNVTDNAGASVKDTIVVLVEAQRYQQDILREVKIYPNPVKDLVNIEIKSPVPNNTVSLILISSKGDLVYQENNIVLIGYSIIKTIDISNFKPGTYFIKVNYGKDFRLVKKIIKG